MRSHLVTLARCLACSGAMLLAGCFPPSPEALRVKALEAELGEILPDAARRLGCNPARLDSELQLERGGERIYRVRGCNARASYRCRSEFVDNEARPSCFHNTSGAAVGRPR